MASAVEIASRALLLIGSSPVNSIDPPDDNERARVVALHFPAARDATLKKSNWRFATRRVELLKDTVAPIYEYLYAYTLPNECIRPLHVDGQDRDENAWEVEEGKILTNLTSPIKVKYTYRNQDAESWDDLFIEAMCHYLASLCAERLTGSQDKALAQLGLFNEKIGDAKSSNSQERTEVNTDATGDDSWLTARL